MMHHEVLGEEEFFGEFYADTFSIWATYIPVSQKMIVLQNIALIQMMRIVDQQKDKKISVTDSDTASEN